MTHEVPTSEHRDIAENPRTNGKSRSETDQICQSEWRQNVRL